MGDSEYRAPVRHEDDDDIVVALTAVCGADGVRRRPGFIQGVVEVPIRGLSVVVVRSRFDLDYGGICRLRAVAKDGAAGQLTFAPTFMVADVLASGDGNRERLADLYNEWVSKGKPNE